MIKNIIKKGIKIKEIQEKVVTKEKTNIWENIKLAYVITMCIIIIFSLPFIYTIFANILIKNQIIESIEQLEKCNNIFVAFNILLVVAFIILILYECNVSPTYIFNKIISNLDISYKKGDSEFHAKNMTYEYDSQEIKDFLDIIINTYGKYTGNQLEAMTHNELPWIEARKGADSNMRSRETIKDSTIYYYYSN